MLQNIKRFLSDESGMQTAEYMILGTIMGAGSIGAVKAVRDGQTAKFEQMTQALDTAIDGTVGGG
jgi:Flp pilus assembly pilin Flp